MLKSVLSDFLQTKKGDRHSYRTMSVTLHKHNRIMGRCEPYLKIRRLKIHSALSPSMTITLLNSIIEYYSISLHFITTNHNCQNFLRKSQKNKERVCNTTPYLLTKNHTIESKLSVSTIFIISIITAKINEIQIYPRCFRCNNLAQKI